MTVLVLSGPDPVSLHSETKRGDFDELAEIDPRVQEAVIAQVQ